MTFYKKIQKYGLQTQGAMLISELKKQNGVNISPDEINIDMLCDAFKVLGVDFPKVKGKKWYQIFKDNNEVKLLNALSLIPFDHARY